MRGTRGMELGPRAKTGVYQPKRIEPLQRIFIEVKPLCLVIRTLIPIEPQPAQIVHEQLGPRTAAGTVVQILDAQHELATLAAKRKPCQKRSRDVP